MKMVNRYAESGKIQKAFGKPCLAIYKAKISKKMNVKWKKSVGELKTMAEGKLLPPFKKALARKTKKVESEVAASVAVAKSSRRMLAEASYSVVFTAEVETESPEELKTVQNTGKAATEDDFAELTATAQAEGAAPESFTDDTETPPENPKPAVEEVGAGEKKEEDGDLNSAG